MSNARSALPARIALLCALSVSSVPLARAQTVAAIEGNIVVTTPCGETKQLSTSGRDSEPALSPDGKTVAFVRAAPEQKISNGSGDDVSEIWTVQSDGSGAGRLVTPRASRKMQEVVALCSAPQFSTGGRRLFFLSTAWVTSEAVHVVDLARARSTSSAPGTNLK